MEFGKSLKEYEGGVLYEVSKMWKRGTAPFLGRVPLSRLWLYLLEFLIDTMMKKQGGLKVDSCIEFLLSNSGLILCICFVVVTYLLDGVLRDDAYYGPIKVDVNAQVPTVLIENCGNRMGDEKIVLKELVVPLSIIE
ncbi:MAG TPA: hypothetical protein DIW31_09195 [Bacteroidales bacterium]|nr:hypothetical protein [Bacteroidales bacterium]